MTPEERAAIRVLLKWQRDPSPDNTTTLRVAAQAVRVSRRKAEGPEPIPCMARAAHSSTMFCVLPKGHEGSTPSEYRVTYHEGLASDGSRRNFRLYGQEAAS